jgi:SagB-type dehydrogenase family enzyme
VTLTDALSRRRSVREFAAAPLTDDEVAHLLWAAQGVTSSDGKRTAPSAGALYPLELYVVDAGGVSRYRPADHALTAVRSGDLRAALAAVAVEQDWIAIAPLVVVILGVTGRTAAKYGDRADRYVALEAGHAAQNLLLQATALGLAGVPVGAFHDADLADLLDLPDGWVPLELVPVGRPA